MKIQGHYPYDYPIAKSISYPGKARYHSHWDYIKISRRACFCFEITCWLIISDSRAVNCVAELPC